MGLGPNGVSTTRSAAPGVCRAGAALEHGPFPFLPRGGAVRHTAPTRHCQKGNRVKVVGEGRGGGGGLDGGGAVLPFVATCCPQRDRPGRGPPRLAWAPGLEPATLDNCLFTLSDCAHAPDPLPGPFIKTTKRGMKLLRGILNTEYLILRENLVALIFHEMCVSEATLAVLRYLAFFVMMKSFSCKR